MMGRPPIPIQAGDRFGRLAVIALHEFRGPGGNRRYVCLCDCGQESVVVGSHLARGDTQSCGCLQRESASELLKQRASTHGHARVGAKSPTYRTWLSMKQRCLNPRNHAWEHYGGRGITVCDRWRESFEDFLADMGERPEGLSLDRIDPDGHYEPGNCRWATRYQQTHNRSRKVAA